MISRFWKEWRAGTRNQCVPGAPHVALSPAGPGARHSAGGFAMPSASTVPPEAGLFAPARFCPSVCACLRFVFAFEAVWDVDFRVDDLPGAPRTSRPPASRPRRSWWGVSRRSRRLRPACAGSLFRFFFVVVSPQFDYDVSRCGFFCSHPARDLSNVCLLDCCFSSNLGRFQLSFLQLFFPPLPPLLRGLPSPGCGPTDIWGLVHFSSLFFRLGNLFCSIFRFILSSTISDLLLSPSWIFHSDYCTFEFWNFPFK